MLDQGIARDQSNIALQLYKIDVLTDIKLLDSAEEVYLRLIELVLCHDLILGLDEFILTRSVSFEVALFLWNESITTRNVVKNTNPKRERGTVSKRPELLPR